MTAEGMSLSAFETQECTSDDAKNARYVTFI